MSLDRFALVALSPILALQALRLRKRALSLPEAAGPRTGITGQGPSLRLLILGDSSAAGVGVTHQNQALCGQLVQLLAPHYKVTWQLIAKTGATTQDAHAMLQANLPFEVDVVVTALGVNDVTHLVPRGRWLKHQHSVIKSLINQSGTRHIYMTGMPPLGKFSLLPTPLRWVLGQRAARFDKALRHRLLSTPKVTYVAQPSDLDPAMMAKDGFHPGPEVYALWAKEMASRILSDWPLQDV